MSRVKVGCCGFAKGREKYFQQFRLVEIQQTFYKPPSVGIVKKWCEEAPQGFEFSLKAWQLITHLPSNPTYRKAGLQFPADKESNYGFFKPGEEVFRAWAKTRNFAEALEAKVILFQCPAKFTETTRNHCKFETFLHHHKQGRLRLCVGATRRVEQLCMMTP